MTIKIPKELFQKNDEFIYINKYTYIYCEEIIELGNSVELVEFHLFPDHCLEPFLQLFFKKSSLLFQ